RRPVQLLALALELAAEPLQLVEQVLGTRRAAGRVLVQERADELVELRRQVRDDHPGPLREGVALLVRQLDQGGGGERRAAGEQSIEHPAEGVKVAAAGGRLAAGGLGRQV